MKFHHFVFTAFAINAGIATVTLIDYAQRGRHGWMAWPLALAELSLRLLVARWRVGVRR